MKINEKNEYVKNIRKKINELDIKSEKEWDEFVKKEQLSQAYSEKWLKQIKSMAKDGYKFEIDLDKLSPDKRFQATTLLKKLNAEIRTLDTGTPVDYSDLYKIISILTTLLGLIYGVAGALGAFENINKNYNRHKLFLKHIKNTPSAKKNSPTTIIKWIKSVISMIKK